MFKRFRGYRFLILSLTWLLFAANGRAQSHSGSIDAALRQSTSFPAASRMIGVHGAEPPTVAEAYNFSDLGVIVDVGGATGNMLAHVLARYPGPVGVLFDRAHVVADAPALLRRRRVVTHAHPYIGVHGVGAVDSGARIVGQLRAGNGLELVALGCRDAYL